MDGHRSLERILGHDHDFAQRKTVRLHHERIFRATAPRMRLKAFGKFPCPRSWDPVPLHEILRKNLRRLKSRRSGAWTENPQPLEFKSVHDTPSQRIVRPDHRQTDRFTLRISYKSRNILRAKRDIFAKLCRPCIARRAIDLSYPRGLRELPRQRMFAPTRTDDQYLHECI